jgi:hypothetical protein
MFVSFIRSIVLVAVLILFSVLALRHFHTLFPNPKPIRVVCYWDQNTRYCIAVVDTIRVVARRPRR